MCICASVPACANIPPQPRRAPAAECPGGPAGTDLGWPAAARGWCRPNQWSPPSAPPAPPAGCPRSGVMRCTGSPAGTPRWTAGGQGRKVIGVKAAFEGLLRRERRLRWQHTKVLLTNVFREKTWFTTSLLISTWLIVQWDFGIWV